jgi:hypothetical protein
MLVVALAAEIAAQTFGLHALQALIEYRNRQMWRSRVIPGAVPPKSSAEDTKSRAILETIAESAQQPCRSLDSALMPYLAAHDQGACVVGCSPSTSIAPHIDGTCRRAIAEGKWQPWVASDLLARATRDESLREVVCVLDLPHAALLYDRWIAESKVTGRAVDAANACALALRRLAATPRR